MGADKGKKPKLGGADNENNGTEQIDAELVLSIEKLQEFQDELDKVNEEASEKVLELEQKYNEIRKPVYDKRNDIIKSIPDFWLTAFMSHPALSELLTDEDQKIFKYLSKLEVEDCKDVKSGYSITFHFESNPYFEDAILTKTFTFFEEGTTEISATAITWKEGMGIPIGVAAEEKKGNKRPKADESFFSWFNNIQHSSNLEEIHDEQVAEIIKDDLWPNPLRYFNNEAADEEGSEMDDDEDKDGDGSEDDDDDDDQDDDENED
ncbi:NAP1-related protein 1-like isoform X1 [Salvia splendens]|uniref:NAP1-related protein 1-like isoform X1 n=1 Tax=Salvia splendens TaxID=180675 RepID=UPI001C26F38F|nr:NAP1-related protein 1-like isoform X1 [Salvia splendens]